jgi:ParB family chromosome partitioning protein
MPKPALGKGLGALINQQNIPQKVNPIASKQEQKPVHPTSDDEPSGDRVQIVPLDQIHPSPLQPRKSFTDEQLNELMESIREHGIIQPLIVRSSSSGYELIAGERRWRASSRLQLNAVPVIIRQASDQDVLEMALIENLQRENLNPLEEAAGYARLRAEFKMKQDEIARRVGKSRAAVANSMRLLELDEQVREALGFSKISVGHAKVLLGVKNKESQRKLAQDIVKKSWTVRQTEKAVQAVNKATLHPTTSPTRKVSSPTFEKVSQFLSSQMSTPVQINAQGAKGSIEISYQNQQDLLRILELLGVDLQNEALSSLK